MLVVCFLIKGEFTTSNIWQKWLMTKKEKVKCVIHADDCNVNEFADHVDAICIPVIATTWGSFEIVDAEIALFDCAQRNFPSVTHFLLVSQDSVPLKSTNFMFETCSQLKDKSMINWYENYNCVNSHNLALSVGIEYSVAAQQFLLLNKKHFVRLKDTVIDMIQNGKNCNDIYDGAPDEFVIATVLFHMFPHDWVWGKITDCHYNPKAKRASYRTKNWITKKIPEKIKFPTILITRKIKKQNCDLALEILSKHNVI